MMSRPLSFQKFAILFMIILGTSWPGWSAANVAEEFAAILEREQMTWLQQQQMKPGVSIKAFKTDGCSGGMSATWAYLAELSPEFARRLGERPPWEHCCVAHDRHYWRGETVYGFEKRLQSDEALRQCVLETGREEADNLAYQLGMSKAETLEMINLTAELMYTAVRIGGGPCTGLPWRWGHGWPECEFELPDESPLKENPQESPQDPI